MEIRFRDKKLREICEKQAVANKKLGAASAHKLRLRLSELEAVANVGELVFGNPHPLRGDRMTQFALSLAGGHRLVFAADHLPIPQRSDGSVDWAAVTIVSIELIGDYHD